MKAPSQTDTVARIPNATYFSCELNTTYSADADAAVAPLRLHPPVVARHGPSDELKDEAFSLLRTLTFVLSGSSSHV